MPLVPIRETDVVPDTVYWLQLTEAQAIDICTGFVPNAVKAMVLRDLDQAQEDHRRAARPVPKTRKARSVE